MSSKKLAFRSHVKDFTETTIKTPFDRLNDFQRSQWMTRAYLESILRMMNPGLLPDDREDFEASFSDGPSDASVDFLARVDGHVLIIQAKYRSHGKIESEHEFSHFCEVLTRLHPTLGRKYKVSERVRDLAADIDWDHDTFDLHFITLGKANDNIRARQAIGQQQIRALPAVEERVEIAFYDESDLNQLLREASTAGEQIAETVSIHFASLKGEPPWLSYEANNGRVSYIGYVKAAQLRNLYSKHKYRLFAQNIRYYVGDTSTNKGIIETALAQPEEFFFFNNGVSAIATEIEPDVETQALRCKRFSVINGAQTVRSIAKAHMKNPSRVSDAAVLMRISQVSFKHSEAEEGFLDSVTRYNNTQNAVKVSDFRSNDVVQRSLAKKFATLYRGGRQCWYKNKRSGERDPRKIPINMEEFAKTIYAFRFGPSDMYGGTSHVFDTSQNGGYLKLFGTDGEVWTSMTDEQFSSLAGTWFLCDKVRETLNQEKARLIEVANEEEEAALIRHALERRWLVFFTVGEILRQKCARGNIDSEDTLSRLAKPKWLEENGGVVKEVKRYTYLACEVLIKVYRSAARSSTFTHRNWFRAQETLREITAEIKYSKTALDILGLLKGDPT